jgi:hypothetical protein
MQALLAEKAFILRNVETAQYNARSLETKRSGLFVSAEKFSPMKLAALLQDIARAKIAELRLMSFVHAVEEKLRAFLRGEKTQTVTIGSEPSPRKPHRHIPLGMLYLAACPLRLQR